MHNSLMWPDMGPGRNWPEAAVYMLARLQVENPSWPSSILDKEASSLLASKFKMNKSPKTVASYRGTNRYREVLNLERLVWYNPEDLELLVRAEDTARGRMRACLRQLAGVGDSLLDRRLYRIIWDLLKGKDRSHVLNEILQGLGSNRQRIRVKKGRRVPTTRKHKYLETQQSFKRNRTKTAREILDNKITGSGDPSLIMGFKLFWENSFAQLRETDCTNMIPVPNANYDQVWQPIYVEDLPCAFRNTKGTASGPDCLDVEEFKGLGKGAILKILNLILYLGKAPKTLKCSRTTFIPKVDQPTLVNHFRPVSVTSIVLRSLHKILAKRLTNSFWLDDRQRGFLPFDGAAENVAVLDGVLSDAKRRRRELVVTLLDFTNAFSSVSHEAIIRAMRCSSMPKGLVDYIEDLYCEFFTTLEIGNESLMVRVMRGILQSSLCRLSSSFWCWTRPFGYFQKELATSYARKLRKIWSAVG